MPTNNSANYNPTQYNVQIGGASGTLANVAPGATTGVPVISQGAAANPIFGTCSISGGGTNATSMSTSTGIVKYDGTSLVTSSTAKIDSSNRWTNTSQPCFDAYVNSAQTNATGDGTTVGVAYNATLFDNNSNFNTSTNTFTAPITGRYQFNIVAVISNIGVAHTNWLVQLITTATTYQVIRINPGVVFEAASGNKELHLCAAVTAAMSANDTATVSFTVSGSTKTITIPATAGGQVVNNFSGFLVC